MLLGATDGAFTVSVMAFVEVQVPLEMVIVPVYVPAAVLAGTAILVTFPPLGEDVKEVEF